MASSTRRLGRSPDPRGQAVYQLDALERQYLDHHRALGHSSKTISHYQDSFASFRRFLAELNYAETSQALTTAVITEFAGWLRTTPTRGWRGSTDRSEFGLHGTMKDLRAFCNWLVTVEFLDRAPKVLVPKLPQTLFPVLSDADLLKIFSTRQLSSKTEIGCRNRALIAFMLDTGVRLSEVTSLTLDDLDLKEGMAKVVGMKEELRDYVPALPGW